MINKYYMGNKHSRKKKINQQKNNKSNNIKYSSIKPYDINMTNVKIVFKNYNGQKMKPKYSYVYKGVPGGWYV